MHIGCLGKLAEPIGDAMGWPDYSFAANCYWLSRRAIARVLTSNFNFQRFTIAARELTGSRLAAR
jgi:hypothetical protein